MPAILLPREHGAWAMLGVSFVSSLILARRIDWEVIPAAVAVVGVFLIREPAVALWRRRAETQAAVRSLAWFLPPTALCGLLLLWRRPFQPLLVLGVAAAALTVVSTWLTVRNLQRSVLLQLISAAGLNASALVAWLAVRPALEGVVWWLWALQFAHSAAAVLVVHARLEARIATRNKRRVYVLARRAIVAQAVLAAGAALCAGMGRAGIAVALALSAGVHIAELIALRRPETLRVPLRHVGQRALMVSVAFSALVLAGLW
jgi:hypothetical protein